MSDISTDPVGNGKDQNLSSSEGQSSKVVEAALNADCDGQKGLLDLAGNGTLLYYMSEEAQEGRNAFVEKRKPDFSKFPRLP